MTPTSALRTRIPRAWSSTLAAIAVLLLAALSILWPRGGQPGSRATFLVLDPLAGARPRQVYQPLARLCADALDRDLEVTVVTNPSDFVALAPAALVALCPDAVALRLSPQTMVPLVAGQRRVPQNLRPQSTLVSRRGAAGGERPWLEAPQRTVFGDSLSLVCLAPICDDGTARWPAGAACAGDPYDHAPALAALRLGAYDHAVVRQWAAENFLAGEFVNPDEWVVRPLSGPLPDIVVLASRELSGQRRLTLRESLVTLGRLSEPAPAAALTAQASLAGIDLDGFALLLELDLEALRGRYGSCWPRSGE